MASPSKKPVTKKRKTTPKPNKAALHAKKQMWAVVLFALGILLGALTILEGANVWRVAHNILFGLFGWSVYFLAPLMIYIAVYAALDKPLGSIKAKLWQLAVLIFMISGAIQIFSGDLPNTGKIWSNADILFRNGVKLESGGVAGAAFAWPLTAAFGQIGASIIILLAIFVFIMLITGSTLVGLFQKLTQPVKNIESAYASRVQDKQAEKIVEKPKLIPVEKNPKQRFDFDIDISKDKDIKETQPDEEDIKPTIEPEIENEPSTNIQINIDNPVEYINAEEFSPNVQAIFAQTDLVEEIIKLHPLDEEIVRAQEDSGDNISEIVDRFMMDSTELEQEISSEQLGESQSQPEVVDLFDTPLVENDTKQVLDKPKPPKPKKYVKPPVSLLMVNKNMVSGDITDELKANAQTLVDTLKSFGVQTRITDICRGPAVTRYELQPSAGVKISKITGLADDIALNLASAGIRIEAPIPNKAAVGIEVPNKNVSMVSIRDIIDSKEFRKAPSSLTVAMGKDIAGNIMLADIGSMPHVLIAGSTGSGKSVCINSIIISILFRATPDEVKLLMIDPKVVELGIYNAIPHLLVPVVTDAKKAAGALGWAVTEMLNRYKIFAAHSVRDLAGYNRLAETSKELEMIPKIVIIIDELSDLMMAAPHDVEDSICRLAQMARAAGMHLVIATQRPSVDVITGIIKANIPSRVAFAVSSMVDSRTILDMGGAEKLLGRGDMLFYPVGSSKPQRVQGCFVTDAEVEAVVGFIKEGETANYDQRISEEIERHVVPEKGNKANSNNNNNSANDEDEMLPQAIECIIEAGQASTSHLQRRLKLGYARAARIIDQLEMKGIVGPFEGSKPRQVMITKDRWLEMKLSGAENTMLKNSEAKSESSAPF